MAEKFVPESLTLNDRKIVDRGPGARGSLPTISIVITLLLNILLQRTNSKRSFAVME